MATLNVIQSKQIYGKTAYVTLSTTSATDVLNNATSSGYVARIKSLLVCNYGASAANITINYVSGGTSYPLVATVSVPAGATLPIIDANSNVYVADGTSLSATAGTANSLTVICGYEQLISSDPAIEVTYLVVAGGGGGGNGAAGANNGGGGGAGGLLTGTSYLDSGVSYSVTVGGGGLALTTGSNSVFNSITALGGGGGGGSSPAIVGKTGGSGGGGGPASPTTGGSGTVGQGNNGANGNSSSPYQGGGGGGAGEAGNVDGLGYGGDGYQSSITGTATFYAGGGGGGADASAGVGGEGGGGNGVIYTSGRAGYEGTANTGGGGGGGASQGITIGGGTGGSGVVIIRSLSTAASTTGSPTLITDGSYKVYKFTSSGSITF